MSRAVLHTRRAPDRSRARGATAALAALFISFITVSLIASCTSIARHDVRSKSPRDPATPWVPPEGARPVPTDTTERHQAIPKELLESKNSWSLGVIVDLALRNNPTTRATWAAARAAAARMGSERGSYFPQIEGDVNYTKQKSSLSSQSIFELTSYTPSLQLQFILFDFGKRVADVEEARQSLYSANWTHNSAIQDVVLDVERAYYQYQNAKAVREADSAAVNEAKANLDAAEERHKAGLATVADVLQARSNHSQKKLALQSVEGQIQTIRGSLATAMGLPPNIDYDIEFLPEKPPVEEVSRAVDDLIRDAEMNRPDLAAAWAAVLGAKANVRSTKAARRPTLSVEGSVSRRYYDNPDNYTDLYLGGVFLSMPLFTGLAREYDIVEAQAKADLAEQQYDQLKSEVDLDVWTSFYDLKTAGERLNTTGEFLASATESHVVALERYKAGVGSILELLAAQTVLEDARSQSIQARTDWFLAISELAHATGRLDASPPPNPTPPGSKEENR